MTSHPNRGWRSRWTVDRAKQEARHGPSGLVVRFARHDEGGWQGDAANGQEVAQALIERHGHHAAVRMLARLMREAGDIYSQAAVA